MVRVRTRTAARYVWAGSASVLGLALAALAVATGGRGHIVGGVVEAWGGAIPRLLRRAVPLAGGAAALTLGHVVLGREEHVLQQFRTHERVHVRQYERWGPFFIPAYLLASAAAWARGGDPYRDNPFEREAFRAAPSDDPPPSHA